MRMSPRSTFTRTLILLAGLLIASQIFSYLAVLNYALLPSLQQFNRILAYEVRLMLEDDVELADGNTFHLDPPRYVASYWSSWESRCISKTALKSRSISKPPR